MKQDTEQNETTSWKKTGREYREKSQKQLQMMQRTDIIHNIQVLGKHIIKVA